MGLIDSIAQTVDYRIAICMPAREQLHTATCYCLWELNSLLNRHNVSSRLFISPGTLIANQRHELVLAAQEWNATHVMFIDSDIEFNPIGILQLLEHDLDVVAACYCKRVEPFINTAWHLLDDWQSWVRISNDDQGLLKVDAVALGFCLININVFYTVDDPWFQLGYFSGQYTGEDIEFCRKLKENNIPVYLDLDVSKSLRHLGTYGFKVVGDD